MHWTHSFHILAPETMPFLNGFRRFKDGMETVFGRRCIEDYRVWLTYIYMMVWMAWVPDLRLGFQIRPTTTGVGSLVVWDAPSLSRCALFVKRTSVLIRSSQSCSLIIWSWRKARITQNRRPDGWWVTSGRGAYPLKAEHIETPAGNIVQKLYRTCRIKI